MTLEEAIDELRERMIELPPNAIDFNHGYETAIRDLEHIAEDADND